MLILGLVDLSIWSILLAGIVGVITLICVYTRYKQRYFQRLGIPSKPTTFLLGDMSEMKKRGLNDYITPDTVKKYGKVFGTYMGNIPLLTIADADIAKQITVKEFSKFTDRPRLISMQKVWDSAVSIAGGDHWRFLRSTLSPSFSSGKLRAMTPYVHKCLDTLHEVLEDKIKNSPEGFDIMPVISGYTLDVICSLGFGLEVSAQIDTEQPLVKHVNKLLGGSGFGNPLVIAQLFFPDLKDTWFSKVTAASAVAMKPFNFLKEATMSTIEDRKAETSKHADLLQNMINAYKADSGEVNENEMLTFDEFKRRGLTDDEVLINSVIFMLAGYNTTYITLSWLMYDLVANPECQERLIQEIDAEIGNDKPTHDNVFKLKYMDMVVNETLRMHSPAPNIARTTVEDVVIDGFHVPKDLTLQISLTALHFMEEYWDEPYKYNPDRFAPENQANINQYAYMPFGHGPRNCIGKRLALLEVKATVVSLLQAYRFHKTDSLTIPMPTGKLHVSKPAKPVTVRLEKRT